MRFAQCRKAGVRPGWLLSLRFRLHVNAGKAGVVVTVIGASFDHLDFWRRRVIFLPMVDLKDLLFLAGGLALMGLTALPLVCGRRIVSVPMLYVAVGAVLAVLPIGWIAIDPREAGLDLKLIEHLTEIIVIVALAAAGLAVDTRAGRTEWQHAWLLIAVTMPLTIAALVLLGLWIGMALPAALLLGAAMAPTDPVLAREVQVGGPTKGQEDDVRLSLTTESGLNDGLAFPFVWLAIVVAGASGAMSNELVWDWVLRDVVWRVVAALAVAGAVGWALARFVIGPWGDRRAGGENAGLVFLGSTFIAYGLTEAIDGYGFLAVFVAARVGRSVSRGTEHESYVLKPYAFGEQFEKILLAVLLLWLGSFAASGALDGLTGREVLVACLLIFVIRPVTGWIGLVLTRGTNFERLAIAFFGIRGMGSFFYIAYAASHAAFAEIDQVWRIAVVAVLLSILIHGVLAPLAMNRLPGRVGSREEART